MRGWSKRLYKHLYTFLYKIYLPIGPFIVLGMYRFYYLVKDPEPPIWKSLLGGMFGLLAAYFILLHVRNTRQKLGITSYTFGTIFTYVGIIIGAATIAFTVISFALYRMQILQYTSNSTITLGRIVDYYLWYLVDAIPGLEFWDTVKVNNPLEGIGFWPGFIVVIFRLSIAIPCIALVIDWWKTRQKKT